MRAKFLLAAMFVAVLMLMPTASALPTEASPGMYAAAITPEAAMTAAAETATLTTPMKPGATEVTRVDACEASAAVALTTISRARPPARRLLRRWPSQHPGSPVRPSLSPSPSV